MRNSDDRTVATGDWQALQGELEALMRAGKMAEAEELQAQMTRERDDRIFGEALQNTLLDEDFGRRLRILGGRLGMRCRGPHPITVRLPRGTLMKMQSPYFVKAQPKGRPKRKPGPGRQRGLHLGLAVLGVMAACCPSLAWRALALAALCPSYQVAETVLKSEGINLGREQLRSLVARFGGLDPAERVRLGVAGGESLAGKRVILAIDAGRCRLRRNKPGKIPEGAKGRSYHADWTAPKLLVVAVLNEEGELDKEFPPLVEGAVAEAEDFLAIVAAHLKALQIDQAAEVHLVADGETWVWQRTPELLQRLGVPADRLTQLVDWTHAKQNLLELEEKLHFVLDREQRRQELCELLYRGDLEGLQQRLADEAAPGQKREVRKKAREYFLDNAARMQYQACKDRCLPRGSGIVESAIRRVVNLRVKAAGSFWLHDHAEAVIFLRSKLLYGRWQILQDNFAKPLVHQFQQLSAEQDRAIAA